MILDATAGNRTMWLQKNKEDIIYIDMEKRLPFKPLIYADDRYTPFRQGIFDIIFFDPPHSYGENDEVRPFNAMEIAKWKDKYGNGPFTYYGWDKYHNREELIRYVYDSQSEFQRILKDDGLLLVKWNEMSIDINKIMSVFFDWDEIMRINVSAPTHSYGTHKTFWCVLKKKNRDTAQKSLSQFVSEKQSIISALEVSQVADSLS